MNVSNLSNLFQQNSIFQQSRPQVLPLFLRRQEVFGQPVQRIVDQRLSELLTQRPALLENAVLLKEIG